MRKIFFAILLALLLSGCFETDFNFKTTVNRNGSIQREVQINERGPSRFLPPSGSHWEIVKAETKPGPSLLGDQENHVHAIGRFKDASQFSSDFHYDNKLLIESLDEDKKKELRDVLKIPEPFEKEIGASNRIELKKKRSFFFTEYRYMEFFEIRHLIPILLQDLREDIAQEENTKMKDAATPQVPLEEARVDELARNRLKEEILPKFQFHSEVSLPGKIIQSNASNIHGGTAVWNFRAIDFEENFSSYGLQVASRAPNIGIMAASFLAVCAVILAFLFAKKKGNLKSRRKNKS